MIEKCIKSDSFAFARFKKNGELENLLSDYQRFYTGSEFCDNALSPEDLDITEYFINKKKKVTFQTPPVSDKCLPMINSALDRINSLLEKGVLNAGNFEITVNDFAVLKLAGLRKFPFRLNAGRLLWRNVFSDNKGICLVSRNEAGFFYRLGISNYELSYPGYPPETNVLMARSIFPGLSLSFFYPYFVLSTTRACIMGVRNLNPGETIKKVNCRRECGMGYFKTDHPYIKEPVYLKGNSVFIKLPADGKLPEDILPGLESAGCGRTVYCPYL